MTSSEKTSQPYIEISLITQDPVFSLDAPWITPLTVALTLRNSQSCVTLLNDILETPLPRTIPFQSEGYTDRIKWSILDTEDDRQIECSPAFPLRARGESIDCQYISLTPDSARLMTLFPFNSLMLEAFPLQMQNFDIDRCYKFQLNISHITSYVPVGGLAHRIQRGRNPGAADPESSPLALHLVGPWTFRFAGQKSSGPWIEVSPIPSTPTFDLSSPSGFHVDLTLTLRNSASKITIPIPRGLSTTTMELRDFDGGLAFVDGETGVAIPRQSPAMFYCTLNSKMPPVRNIAWLIGHCFTLVPDQPLQVQHELFVEGQNEYRYTKKQFKEGKSLFLEVEQPWFLTKWLKGTRVGHVLWRAVTGYWLAEPGWETERIPFIQRLSESITVVRT
ncbi:hypothetical protein MBLNU459_g4265t1 [Dothideomycetes sp. NU459]